MLTNLQIQILNFAKEQSFHGTLAEFISSKGVPEIEALSALKDLKSKRIVSMPPDSLNSWIGVTNYGWKVMGWKKHM